MIEIQGLTQAFGSNIVLNDVSLTIEEQEICALVGRNGAGKSTLIQSLLGLIRVKKGRVIINGRERRHATKERRHDLAYLPEKFLLYPMLSGYENIMFFAKLSRQQVDEARVERLLTEVQLWDDRHKLVNTYSKGMLQRLGLAITLYQDAPILVLDEPTSGLDPMGRAELLHTLQQLQGKTILLSSHHLDEIKQLCTHVAFLEEGKVTKYTVEEFIQMNLVGA